MLSNRNYEENILIGTFSRNVFSWPPASIQLTSLHSSKLLFFQASFAQLRTHLLLLLLLISTPPHPPIPISYSQILSYMSPFHSTWQSSFLSKTWLINTLQTRQYVCHKPCYQYQTAWCHINTTTERLIVFLIILSLTKAHSVRVFQSI